MDDLSTPTDKPTRMRGVDRRAFILAQTTKVFAQYGYAQASIGDLARASEVTEPMLYKHFGSKRNLFLEVLKDVGLRFIERFRTAVLAKAADDLGTALAEILLDYRTAAMAESDNLRVLVDAMRDSNDPEIATFGSFHGQEMYALVHDLLTQAQQRALVPPHLDLDAASWGYISLIAGVQYRAQINVIEQFTGPMLQEINRLWWQSLRKG